MPGPSSEPEKYTIDEMMERLNAPSESSSPTGELVTRADGSQAIRVKRRKRRAHQPHKERAVRQQRFRIALIVASVIGVSAIGLGVIGVVVYGNSAPFRNSLIHKLTESTGAEVSLNQFRMNPTGANANQVQLRWPEGSPIQQAIATGLGAQTSPISFSGSGLKGTDMSAQEAQITFGSGVTTPVTSGSLPFTFDRYAVQKLTFGFGSSATLGKTDASLTTNNDRGNAEMRLAGGTLKATGWPELRLDRATLEAKGKQWELVSAYCEHPTDNFGSLLLSGTIQPWNNDQESVLTVKAESFQISGLIGQPFARLISGRIDTTATPTSNFLTLKPNAASPVKLNVEWQASVNGSFEISGFPFLSVLSQATDDRSYESPRFITEISGAIQRDTETVTVRDFHAVNKRHMALKGHLTLNTVTKALSGQLLLGLPESMIKLTRGFSPHFSPISEEFRWIEIKIGGTLDSPTDDFETQLRSATPSNADTPAPARSSFEELTTPQR